MSNPILKAIHSIIRTKADYVMIYTFLDSVYQGLHELWVWVLWVLSVLGAQRVLAAQGKYLSTFL